MSWGLQTTTWAVIAALLIAAEIIAPGAFMLWLGIAAAAVCVVVWLVPGLALVWQVVLFGVLSVLSIGVYRRWFRHPAHASDQPALNRRAEQLVGRVVPLSHAIVEGRGRVQIADALWDVEGPDLAAGEPVQVVGVRGMVLQVRSPG